MYHIAMLTPHEQLVETFYQGFMEQSLDH